MSNVELLPTWSVLSAEGRARAAQLIGDLAKTGNVPAFRKEAEAVLAMKPGVVAGFWACLADRLA
jgi:hypothetical protein